MNDLQLAEMVLSKEITLEDALEMCDDANGMLRILGIRKSMRYAMRAAAAGRLLEKTAKSLEEAAAARQFYRGKLEDYFAQMLELRISVESQRRHIKDLEGQRRKGDRPARMIKEDLQDVVWEYRYGGGKALNPLSETNAQIHAWERKIAELEGQIAELGNAQSKYAISAIAQSFAEVFDYLAEELGN